MNGTGLDFEKPILELERKVEELKKFTSSENIDLSSEIKKLEDKLDKVKREVFESLSPWQRVQIARHPKRPYTLDYIGLMMTDFVEIHGDRVFGDDKALICGFAKIDGQDVVVMGHQKGRDTKENLMRNFGSAHPEGYRKAMRVMHMGEKFKLPVIVFIDTPGAYPGIGAEERGQAEAIALNLMEMARLKVPIVCYIIGEGGSGGALGVGIGDRICVLENAYYSVISPEGCAAILWKDRTRAPDAAKALK
ncbi:MAG: acetyl-CoA carboxylase carboxyltransferase subunit alpha, partial [Candidatus Omnitrophota bacterium]